MKKMTVVTAAACLLLAPALAEARGGGGIEYFTNLGTDVLGPVTVAPGVLVHAPTGSVSVLSAYGFGITSGGWKIGGFATGFYAAGLSLPFPSLGEAITTAAGGVGGVISGGFARWDQFCLSMDLRLGAGGMAVGMVDDPPIAGAVPFWTGVFTLYGALSAEAGFLFVPAMLISLRVGLDAVVAFSYSGPFPVAVPTMGIRFTWGRF